MSEDGKFIVSGSYHSTVRIWNVLKKTQVSKLKGHTNYVSAVCIIKDGKIIASGSGDRTVSIWSVANKNQVAVLTGHTEWVSI
jgi:WD40 repeat protein